MNRITISYEISRTTALTEGRAEYGRGQYSPTDTELTFLDVADRAYLDRHEQETFKLSTATPPTWPVLADAIKSARIDEETRLAREAAETEEKIQKALAKPDEDWTCSHYEFKNVCVPNFGSLSYAPHAVRDDPRVAARIAAVRVIVDAHNAEVNAKNKVEEEKRREATKAAEAQRLANLESIKQWALASEDPAIARAAREDYDVIGAVLQDVAYQLSRQVDGEISREGTEHWRRWDFEKRACPSLEAFEAYDAMVEAVSKLNKPAGVKVEVMPIARVTLQPKENDVDVEPKYFTAVIAFVTLPDTGAMDRAVIVRVEE